MRILLIALVTVFVALGAMSTLSDPIVLYDPAAAVQPWPSVQRVDDLGCNGSAVPIMPAPDKQTWFLTAKHVLPIDTIGGAIIVRVERHPTRDLVLVLVDRVFPCVKMAPTQPMLGDRVFTVGYPYDLCLHVGEGRQAGVTTESSAPCFPGCSGGALVNERRELAGIVTQGYQKDDIPLGNLMRYEPLFTAKDWIISITE